MENSRISEETLMDNDDKWLYVAVGKDLKASKSTLLWALRNSRGKGICLLYVHQPAHPIPLVYGTRFLASQTEEPQVREDRYIEKQAMNKLLQNYSLICEKAGVQASTLYNKMNPIEKGIIELITCNGIRKLVMGAAADKHYSKKMMEPKSKKAIYICEHAPSTCHIWFICKGNLVHTREGRLDGADIDVASSVLQTTQKEGTVESNLSGSKSVIEGKHGQLHLPLSGSGYRRARSEIPLVENLNLSPSSSGGVTPSVKSSPDRIFNDWNQKTGMSPIISVNSHCSISSTSDVADGSSLPHQIQNHQQLLSTPSQLHLPLSGSGYRRARSEIPLVENLNLSPSSSGGVTPSVKSSPDRIFNDWNQITGMSPIISVNSHCSISSTSDVADGSSLPHQIQNHQQLLSPPSVLEGGMNDGLYDQLEQAMAEAENSKREAFEESLKRRKAEKDIINAIRRGKISDNLFSEELRRRKEAEEALAWGNVELEMMKQQLNETIEELCDAKEQKQSLEKQIANSEWTVHELEQKMFSSVELLQKYKKEKDELEVECDSAIKMAEELKKKQAIEGSSTSTPRSFYEFSLSEIEEATNYFDLSLKIWEGGYSSVYRGFLRHTPVAIKILQVPSDFEQEVSFLSKLRHRNLVTLIGACREACALVYEYLPNGSLEDRLNCSDNTSPLSWQTRIRIAAELCSVLIFLHSCNPHSISHGDLNPSNILLDTHYVSKVCDFRLNRIFIENKALESTIFCCVSDNTKGTLAYIDPEFVATQELMPESDVYSFGVILLRLLINKSALGIINEVQCAFDDGNLNNLLDHTAGDWPFVQAKQLAHLAMRCCEKNTKNRPDLAYEVYRVLETMLVSCGASSTRLGSEEHRQIPHYFVCPIFQEIMEDPHVAADGFTYELEALKGWLDSGHETSPMTNLKLPHHNLVPNRALRSAIQEWQQNK